MAQSISLDKETFKALAGETRVQILKELNERQKTQSELAAKLGLSAPTVNEHLLLLKKAGLVQEIDDGHKWKYFSLTQKGRKIFNPGEVQIMLVLSILSIAFVGLLLMFFSQLAGQFSFSAQKLANVQATIGAASEATKVAASGAPELASQAACPTANIAQQLPLPEIALLLVSACFIGLMLGYLLKQK